MNQNYWNKFIETNKKCKKVLPIIIIHQLKLILCGVVNF